ncbi:hypothetical protein D3C87_1792250 [compost metagenome]
MAGNIGLERKLMQQRLAKGMDGLDLQATGRFQRLGKQLTRSRQRRAIWLLALDGGDAL